MHKKWVLVPVAAAAVGIGAFSLTAGSASAHGMGVGDHGTMIARLAQAFGKSEDEVKAVLEQVRSEQEAARLAELTAKLDAGVSAGQITSEQKQLILDKFAAMKAEREAQHQAWKDSGEKPTMAIRHENRQDRKTELETWATDNGISTEFLRSLFKPSKQ
jgi:hypothetical protein